MFSVVILPAPGLLEGATQEGVARTVAALVGAVVDEVVADAFVIGRPGLDLGAIEQASGCRAVLESRPDVAVRRALGLARRDAVLVLAPGYAPGEQFAHEAHARLHGERDRAWSIRAAPDSWLARIMPFRETVGLIASRRAVLDLEGAAMQSVPAMARALSAKPMRSEAVRL